MRKTILMLIAVLSAGVASAQTWPEGGIEAKPGTRWWWLGSAVNEQDLQWNMRQYSQHGLGTLEITPLYGVQGNDGNNIPFLSPQWMRMLKFVEEEGQRDQLQIDMNCGTGWPFGGPTTPIEEAACKAVFIDTLIHATTVDLGKIRLEVPEKERPYAKLQCVKTFPTVEKDTWRVIALYESRTRQMVKRAAPGGEGLVIDHFDSTAVKHYLQRFEEAFTQSGTPYPNTFFNDSYEVYGANWTPTLLDEFQKRRGYRLEDNLNKLLDRDPEILSDYRETLGELLLQNFTEQWVRWSHRHGVQVRNQAHGSPANLIDVYAAVDIPEIEGFGLSEFGIKGLRTDPGMTKKNFSDLSMLKYAPSAAHITGKPLVSSETFTWLTEHFRTSLSQLKPDIDLMFCAGVNHMFFHGTCYSPKDDPWPGWKFYASIDMSPTNSIWRDAPYFMQYVERCQRFLQWGKPDNDFLVYLPVRDMWAQPGKELLMQFDIHSMAEKAPDFIRDILAIDSLGYDCDYISDQYLLSTLCKDGLLQTASGTRYKGLIIPGDVRMTATLRRQIAMLKAQGARIITGTDADKMAEAAQAEEMKSRYHLHAIRRSDSTGYHYFIANLSPDDIDEMVTLAVPFNSAVLFNPLDGSIRLAETRDGQVRLALRSGASVILQTYNEQQNFTIATYDYPKDTEGEQIDLTHNPWTLSFTEEAPSVSKKFHLNQLQTWESLDENTRKTMGTGVYTTTVRLSKRQAKQSWTIDLGDVRESARVYINGELAGCAWSVPFELDCKNLLRKGDNEIRIEVTNLPANRIADLDRQGIKWRKFNEINVVDINYKRTTYENWDPVPSGLNGKVILKASH